VATRIAPAEGTLRHAGNDWLGRGPVLLRDHEKYHAGLDIFNNGKRVVAPESGRVIVALHQIPSGKTVYGGYGPGVVVIHGESGVYHWLAHVKNPTVERNDPVVAGQIIAEATTDHVHWELRQILIPYKGTAYWPWTVTLDPIRWLIFRELTAMDAIHNAKQLLPGGEYKDPKQRMEVIRRPHTEQGKPIYPIPLKWTKALKGAILLDEHELRKRAEKRGKEKTIALAAGLFAGLAVLSAILL
jgi:murein DD-endopeptidase MepM/ murein hydrolase activator NlpD